MPRVQESKSGSFLSSGPSGKRIGGRRQAALVMAVVVVMVVKATQAVQEVMAIDVTMVLAVADGKEVAVVLVAQHW